MWYAVARIDSGEILLASLNIARVAQHLKQGTCYGWGDSKHAAVLHARSQATRFRRIPCPAPSSSPVATESPPTAT